MPEEFDDPNHHQALAFEYYTEAYGFFLDGADAFEDQDQVLENRYGRSVIFEKSFHSLFVQRRRMSVSWRI